MKDIVIYPNPVLTTPCEFVTDFGAELLDLTEQMFASMYEFKGIGLAANQIGVSKRVAVIDLQRGDGKMVFVNPRIVKQHGTHQPREGCLSVPGIYEYRTRTVSVDVDYYDLKGRPQTIHATWLLAQALQHECDHLEGRLCLTQYTLDQFVKEQSESIAMVEKAEKQAITK